MIKKFLEAQIKSVNKEEGTFEVVASCGKIDRLGDTIDPKGWYLTNYKKNPVILWSHSTGGMFGTAIPPVARAEKVWVEDEKELRLKGKWADTPFAQELRALVEGGFLNAGSVGFLPLVEDDKGKMLIGKGTYRRATDEEIKKGMYDSEYGEKFTHQELLEWSWVNVPALPQALVSARKMNLSLVTKALEEEIKEKGKEEEKEIDADGVKVLKTIGGTLTFTQIEKIVQMFKEVKEGRVISEKNRKLIDNTITAMEEAISALKELHEATEPDKSTTPLESKGRKPFVKQKSKKSEMERLLIMFDKMCEALLRKLRQ